MNLNTKLSLFRLILLPVLLNLIYLESWRWATVLFVAASCSALLSHHLLHKKSQLEVGSFLDPFASKILIMGLLLTFVLIGSYWIIPFAFFILRDVLEIILRWRATQENIYLLEEKYRDGVLVCLFLLVFILFFAQWLHHSYFPFLLIITVITVITLILSSISLYFQIVTYVQKLRQYIRVGKQINPEKTIILANTASRGYKDAYRRHLLKVFARRRKATILYLQGKNIYRRLHAKIQHFPHVIIAGGDGSFESALNYQQLDHKILGFFPLGAGNAYYSYFYRGKRYEYLRSRFQFQEAKLDILELRWNGKKIATAFATIGFDAEVIHSARERTSQGFMDYVKGALTTAKHAAKTFTLRVTIDKVTSTLPDCLNFNFGKIPYYGYGLRSLFGEVHGADNHIYALALLNTHAPYWNNIVRGWGLLLAAFHINKDPLLSVRGKTMTIESSEPFPLQAGGEFLGYTRHVQVRVQRQQKVLII